MENLDKFLKQVFWVVIFCIATSLIYTQFNIYNNGLERSKKILTDELVFQQYVTIDEFIFTKGELLLLLCNDPLYDVEIDGLLISKYENVKENLANLIIKDAEYYRKYDYDNYGNITRILYNSIK